MIYAVTILVFIILFFPFTIRLRVLFNSKNKKIFYSINLYGILKLNCGYIGFANNRLVLRYGKNKEVPLKYKDMFLDDTKVDVINHFDLIKSSSAIILGGINEDLNLWLAIIIKTLNPIIYRLFKFKSPNINYKNDIILLSENTAVGGLVEIVAVSNIFAMIELIIKKYIGEFITYVQGKKG